MKAVEGGIYMSLGTEERTSLDEVLTMLPQTLRRVLSAVPWQVRAQVEELRLRVDRPLVLHTATQRELITVGGTVAKQPREAFHVSAEEVKQSLARLTEWSLYAVEEEIRQGFLTIRGGHRVGLAGQVHVEHGQIRLIQPITALNIRICREIHGAADPLVTRLRAARRMPSVLIYSAPQAGKTTLLRDLIRQLSSGANALKIAVIDERGELAGCVQGIPQRDLGWHSDVLDACPKAKGMLMAIRALSPELLATDEIGHRDDVLALREALCCGVQAVATAHAGSYAELVSRPELGALIQDGGFGLLVELSRRHGPGTIEGCYDARGRPLS